MCFFLTVPTGKLEEVVSDSDITKIARDHLTDWESLRPYLGLSRQQKKEIHMSHPGDYGKQKWECLEMWKNMKRKKATYNALISAAEEMGDQKLASGVRAMLSSKDPHSECYVCELVSQLIHVPVLTWCVLVGTFHLPPPLPLSLALPLSPFTCTCVYIVPGICTCTCVINLVLNLVQCPVCLLYHHQSLQSSQLHTH